ncbi:hypothetical protein PMIN06_010023 [Paraphaeosphaeria minitans]|uniref:5'/3'-nucleotidase SurE n=1 Tax=Paraphaeosphaeria minitans TaxID=565426 RepID=A0A9P6GQX8_9PLEO|nr:5'/3'-nucleotidase SurE [Paraphaeosphaeria minitans]
MATATASPPSPDPTKIYALIAYEDPYVQPLIVAAVQRCFPPGTIQLITSLDDVPSKFSRLLQWVQYESIDFEHLLSQPSVHLANAYVIRKALIRKHYLSTTVANWVAKHPASALVKGWKQGVEFEVDYAEFLDDALVEAWELRESWARGEGGKREWWILKPGMSERGQGIRLFSSEEELTTIFEGWDPESDDEEEDEDEDEDARSDAAGEEEKDVDDGDGIITSQLRHFVAQPYIHPPLLFQNRKFHIRTYVLATSALRVYVYKPLLALFAARPYSAPSSTAFEDGDAEDALRSHLTNTCLQDTGEREGSVGLFWDLPDSIPPQPSFSDDEDAIKEFDIPLDATWKSVVFARVCSITGEVFEAAARAMSIHFQPLPNAFEIFGLDFMVGREPDGELRTYLLEVNAFPDFRQTGDECKGVVEGLMESVVRTAVVPFFDAEKKMEVGDGEDGGLVKVLDVDLGRR